KSDRVHRDGQSQLANELTFEQHHEHGSPHVHHATQHVHEGVATANLQRRALAEAHCLTTADDARLGWLAVATDVTHSGSVARGHFPCRSPTSILLAPQTRHPL